MKSKFLLNFDSFSQKSAKMAQKLKFCTKKLTPSFSWRNFTPVPKKSDIYILVPNQPKFGRNRRIWAKIVEISQKFQRHRFFVQFCAHEQKIRDFNFLVHFGSIFLDRFGRKKIIPQKHPFWPFWNIAKLFQKHFHIQK